MRRGCLLLLGVLAIAATSCGGTSQNDGATSADASRVTAHPSQTTTPKAGCTPASPRREESTIAYDRLPPVTKAEVDKVRAVWATKYPTAADATRAGWFKATPSLFGIGAHYVKNVSAFSVAAPFRFLRPPILLYDGEGPDAAFAGLSYVVKGDVPGFAGCFDVWHSHPSVCIDKEHRITLTEAHSWRWYSERECTAHGGYVMKLEADRMIHLWIGPGYTKAPIFAHDNPKLFDGYYPKRGVTS